MNQPIPTGPDRFAFAESAYGKAREAAYGSVEETYQFKAAQHHAAQAKTAAIVMLTEVIANASGVDHDDLDAWRARIGMSWLTECKSENRRRPQCAEWHTEDCPYTEPVPPTGTRVRYRIGDQRPFGITKEYARLSDGTMRVRVQWDNAELSWVDWSDVDSVDHELLPIGTRVLVSDPHGRKCGCSNAQPWVGKIAGYDMGRTKYQINEERYGSPGEYYNFVRWAFADNRVEVHPDGPETCDKEG